MDNPLVNICATVRHIFSASKVAQGEAVMILLFRDRHYRAVVSTDNLSYFVF